MSQKMRNTEKMWEKEGYDVVGTSIRTHKSGTFTEIGVKIKSSPEDRVDFYKDRVKMYNLADRQGCLVIPEIENNGDDVAQVLLVNRKLIYTMSGKIRDLVYTHKQCYWYVLRDEEFVDFLNTLWSAKEMLDDLYQANEEMHRVKTYSGTRVSFEKLLTARMYYEFKDLFRQVTYEMSKCDKFDEKLIEEQEEYVRYYP